LVHIIVSKYSKVSDYELNNIVRLMEECYYRLSPHVVSLVDLYVFESSSLAKAFLLMERKKFGVETSSFDDLFFAMHDAWRGTPRIILCLDRIRELPELVRIGAIRHEVGHTVLHGSIEYYVLPLPKTLLELMKLFNLSRKYVLDLLYLVSVAVKDYEVTRLLYQRGYIEDQVAYVKFLLKISEDDIISWNASQGNPLLEALYLIGLLKTVGCAIPLLADKNLSNEIKACMKSSVSYLPKHLSSLILNIAEGDFVNLGNDTWSNVSYITHACKPILNAIFKKRGMSDL